MISQNQCNGLLQRLRSDTSGNALMIGAAAMFPLIGIVGGALDVGRLYAAKTRLQHACDSAVLGGRQAMTGKAWTADSTQVAGQLFSMNYPAGKYGTTFPAATGGGIDGITFTPNTDGSVEAIAEALVPMTLMRVFGATENKVQVACKAQINLPDTDVMMVLDTTGSMAETNPGDFENRITSLRKAVKGFHTVLSDANAAGAKIRYGFVPYSTTVNVGALLKPDWVVDKWDYQSRKPDGVKTVGGSGNVVDYTYKDNWDQQSPNGSRTFATTNLPLENCVKPASSVAWGASTLISDTSTPFAGPPVGTKRVKVFEYTANGTDYDLSQTATSCQLTTITYSNFVERYNQNTIPVYETAQTYYDWEYDQIEYDVASLTVGGAITAPIGANHANRAVTWDGCIQERSTVAITDYSTIPANAYDLNIDLTPTSDPATQWRPALAKLVFARESMTNWRLSKVKTNADYTNVGDYQGGSYATCPVASRKLAPISETELTTYLDSLTPAGGTYHDIGMIWGARLLSSTGIFKDENKGGAARHLIFMTDGQTDTRPDIYDAYGWTALDRRRELNNSIVPTKANLDKTVEDRFDAMCEATKNKNVTIWVIAFGTTLSPMLESCASSARSFQANNAAELTATFSEIGERIAHLRLVK